MKFVRYGLAGNERPGVIDAAGNIRDLSAYTDDINGAALAAGLIDKVASLNLEMLPFAPEKQRLGSPIAEPSKIVCIGLNYVDHALEGGRAIPDEPVLFMKSTTSITGPNDTILIPQNSIRTDWEIELGVVIAKDTHYVSEDDALSCVAGYVLANDISERDHQLRRGGEWTKGKSHDTFCPLGPWLVSQDELGDASDIGLQLSVNNIQRQNGHTRDLIFSVAYSVAYISQFMTLRAGDIILTGTPAGVGQSIKPDPVFLHANDTMTMSATGLGQQTHVFANYRG